jgi:hypothetical protein
MKQHPKIKGIVGIPKLISDPEFVLRIPHLINHPIEFLSVELAVVILDVLHMDVGQLLIALPFFDRPMGIPFGILHP